MAYMHGCNSYTVLQYRNSKNKSFKRILKNRKVERHWGKKKKLSNLPNHALSMHDLENQMFSVQKKPNPPKKMPEKCFLFPLTNLFPQKNWYILGSDPSLGGSNLKSDAQIYVALS